MQDFAGPGSGYPVSKHAVTRISEALHYDLAARESKMKW
jgi:hypothetical protein